MTQKGVKGGAGVGLASKSSSSASLLPSRSFFPSSVFPYIRRRCATLLQSHFSRPFRCVRGFRPSRSRLAHQVRRDLSRIPDFSRTPQTKVGSPSRPLKTSTGHSQRRISRNSSLPRLEPPSRHGGTDVVRSVRQRGALLARRFDRRPCVWHLRRQSPPPSSDEVPLTVDRVAVGRSVDGRSHLPSSGQLLSILRQPRRDPPEGHGRCYHRDPECVPVVHIVIDKS